MNDDEIKRRKSEFLQFKKNYEYYDVLIPSEELQIFERYVSGKINIEQLLIDFENVKTSIEKLRYLPINDNTEYRQARSLTVRIVVTPSEN